ncbi:MAG: STN domain-containing protein, partial [Acidobacteriota bacterium]
MFAAAYRPRPLSAPGGVGTAGSNQRLRQAVASAAQTASAAPRRFDIPAGSLGTALQLFEHATGIHLTVPPDLVRAQVTKGLAGTFAPAEALTRLFDGTRLTAQFTSATAATVEFRIDSETVRVDA